MSHFSSGQLNQLGDKLEEAGWCADDVTNLGQASVERLTEVRLLLARSSDIVSAIEVGKTELWLHEDQKTGWVQGHKILLHLTNNDLLAGCADLGELKVVQSRGLNFFRKHFWGKSVFGWRGVQDGRVPYLVEDYVRVALDWDHLISSWSASSPALRRKV